MSIYLFTVTTSYPYEGESLQSVWSHPSDAVAAALQETIHRWSGGTVEVRAVLLDKYDCEPPDEIGDGVAWYKGVGHSLYDSDTLRWHYDARPYPRANPRDEFFSHQEHLAQMWGKWPVLSRANEISWDRRGYYEILLGVLKWDVVVSGMNGYSDQEIRDQDRALTIFFWTLQLGVFIVIWIFGAWWFLFINVFAVGYGLNHGIIGKRKAAKPRRASGEMTDYLICPSCNNPGPHLIIGATMTGDNELICRQCDVKFADDEL